ncbi:MAG: HEAT repeat domain-containing protein [Planctomycetota bacterium]|nr:HEAT repeat domain-containing protein [Planctomycetota bacterium]
MRTALLLAVLALFSAPTLIAQDEARDPEGRLLRAELLEVSNGELEGAMKEYRSLVEDAETPPGVRDKARLCLGRCLRKRGDLEGARKILRALTDDEKTDRTVARRAASFLREIETGKSENPDFDWIGELQKNPAIRARIFDYVMDLVEEDSKALAASRQLLALGTLTVPMLEQAAKNSRDEDHRRRLALILGHMGRYELLEPALSWQGDLRVVGVVRVDRWLIQSFVQRTRSLKAAERQTLVSAVARLASGRADPALRALVLLHAGERRDLPRLLGAIEGVYSTNWGYTDQLLEELGRTEEGCRGMRARLLEESCAVGAALAYLPRVLDSHPQLVEARHHVAFLGHDSPPVRAVRGVLVATTVDPEFEQVAFRALAGLEELGQLDALEPLGEKVDSLAVRYFQTTYLLAKRLAEVPAGWGAVLARREPDWLRQAAERNDDLVGALEKLLLREDFDGSGSWSRQDAGWRPSAAYVEAMVRVLETAKHPHALGVALEALSLAPAGGPEVLERLERLVGERPDWHVREMALYTALERSVSRPGTARRVARLLVGDFETRSGHRLPESYFDSPLADASGRGHVFTGREYQLRVLAGSGQKLRRGYRFERPHRRRSGSAGISGAEKFEAYSEFPMEWIPDALGDEAVLDFHQHLLEESGSPAGQGLYRWFADQVGRTFLERLVVDLPGCGDPAARDFGLRLLGDSVRERTVKTRRQQRVEAEKVPVPVNLGEPRFVAFLRDLARDREVPVATRVDAVVLGGQRIGDWFDWPALVGSDDPLVPGLTRHFWDVLARGLDRALSVLRDPGRDPKDRQHSEEIIQRGAFSIDEYRAIVRASLESPANEWRRQAVQRLGRVAAGPDYVRLLGGLAGDDDSEVYASLFLPLLGSKDPSALPPIARLLGARPDFSWSSYGNFDLPKRVEAWPEAARPRLAALFYDAAAAFWRRRALSDLFDPARDDVDRLKKGLEDPDVRVRRAAFTQLLQFTRNEAAPLLIDVLKDPRWRDYRTRTVGALSALAVPESLVPLGELLGDADSTVRNGALAALEKIRQNLEQRREWEKTLEDLRQGHPPKPPEGPEAPEGEDSEGAEETNDDPKTGGT